MTPVLILEGGLKKSAVKKSDLHFLKKTSFKFYLGKCPNFYHGKSPILLATRYHKLLLISCVKFVATWSQALLKLTKILVEDQLIQLW